MKKLLILSAIMLTTLVSFTQVKNTLHPYIGVGTSLSSNTLSYAGEVGVYNNKAWYAATVSTYDAGRTNPVYVGGKVYLKVAQHSTIDLFGYGGVSVNVDKPHNIVFEPGVAAVFNFGNFGPQVSFGLPLNENGVLFKPLTMSLGVSVNYFFSGK